MKELKKLWLDTTTNPATGKYSQKRLMMWGSFLIAILMCLVSVFEIRTKPEWDFSTRKDVPLEIIGLLLLYAFGVSGATLAGHFLNRKTQDGNGAPLAPPYVEPEQKNEQI